MSAKVQISKKMSYLLRHKPEDAGLHMDSHGWVEVDELSKNTGISKQMIENIVKISDKQRYSLSSDKKFIRANQGHSFKVDLDLEPAQPPDILYHGTAERFRPLIDKEGIKHMERQYVHLSESREVASSVGSRHGKVFIYVIDAKKMFSDGVKFYHSVNGVWLTDYVDPKYFLTFN